MKYKFLRIMLNITAVIFVIFESVFSFLSEKFIYIIQKLPADTVRIIDIFWLSMNKYFVLFFFVVFLVISECLGILSFMLLAKGLIIPFMFVYIFKFLPFFIMKYIFHLTKDELLTIKWFNFCYIKTNNFIDYLMNTEIVLSTKQLIERLKDTVKDIKWKF